MEKSIKTEKARLDSGMWEPSQLSAGDHVANETCQQRQLSTTPGQGGLAPFLFLLLLGVPFAAALA